MFNKCSCVQFLYFPYLLLFLFSFVCLFIVCFVLFFCFWIAHLWCNCVVFLFVSIIVGIYFWVISSFEVFRNMVLYVVWVLLFGFSLDPQNHEILGLVSLIVDVWVVSLKMYTVKLPFHQLSTRRSHYTVIGQWICSQCWQLLAERWLHCQWELSHCSACSCQQSLHSHCPVTV